MKCYQNGFKLQDWKVPYKIKWNIYIEYIKNNNPFQIRFNFWSSCCVLGKSLSCNACTWFTKHSQPFSGSTHPKLMDSWILLKLHSVYPIFGGLVFLVLLIVITPTKRVTSSASQGRAAGRGWHGNKNAPQSPYQETHTCPAHFTLQLYCIECLHQCLSSK